MRPPRMLRIAEPSGSYATTPLACACTASIVHGLWGSIINGYAKCTKHMLHTGAPNVATHKIQRYGVGHVFIDQRAKLCPIHSTARNYPFVRKQSSKLMSANMLNARRQEAFF